MKCQNCDNEIKDDATFCGYCGSKINKVVEQKNHKPIDSLVSVDRSNTNNSHSLLFVFIGISLIVIVGGYLLYNIYRVDEVEDENVESTFTEESTKATVEASSVITTEHNQEAVSDKPQSTDIVEYGMIKDSDGFANIREEPYTNSNIINTIHHNEEFVILNKSGEWWLVSNDKNIKGYLPCSIIKIVHKTVYGDYPEASTRYLSREELIKLNPKQLRIMRNEIFARYGYVFKSSDMREYFENLSWYKNLLKLDAKNNASSLLTETEKANIILIKKIENQKNKY